MSQIPIDSHIAVDNTTEENNKLLKFVEDVTNDPDQYQHRVLNEILSRNANVEYLVRHGLDGRTDRASFKRLIPVVNYEDLQHDIIRIANGDRSPILCAQPISEFLTSSGTSGGERKLMPTIEEEMDRRHFLYSLLMPVMSQYIQGLEDGKGMYLFFVKSGYKTPGGLQARPVLTSLYNSLQFKDGVERLHTSPIETILCYDSDQSMYSQLLCGLLSQKQVLRVGAGFASGFIRAINFLKKHWADLCRDIHNGVLDAKITEPAVREAVMRILKPNPKLAEIIHNECSKDSWKGIITRLWPNTKYIDVIITGSMAQYIPELNDYGNGLPLVSSGYASSECYFGVNLEPLCNPSDVVYTIIPTMGYFEFIPIHGNDYEPLDTKEEQQLVDLAHVKVGKEYELVVTTYGGLYRYRVGDVLRVAAFKNKAPQFKFICRKNVMLSIDSDKTDEVELQAAVETAVEHLKPFDAALAEYTSYADPSSNPGHYVIYWELRRGTAVVPVPKSVFEDCCLAMEESLNSVYRQGRVSDKSIGPLEIKVVEAGTFEKLMDFAVSRGASFNQYKTPRCIKLSSMVELLNSGVVGSYRSLQCPKWTPGPKQWN